jgi:hypothetical protein
MRRRRTRLDLSGVPCLRPALSRRPEVMPATQSVLPGHRHGVRAEPLSCCIVRRPSSTTAATSLTVALLSIREGRPHSHSLKSLTA